MDTDGQLVLRPFGPQDEAPATTAGVELARDGFAFLLDRERAGTWADYVAMLEAWSRGVQLPADRVPAAFLAAEVDGVLVGRASIRLELNDWLTEWGGNIGYGVRPQFRRRGYATRILQLSLDRLRSTGLDRALITCDEDNFGSASVIEGCGGVFERYTAPDGGAPKRRYWVTL